MFLSWVLGCSQHVVSHMANPAAAKKPANKDWHWKDVVAALHKRGWSLRQIGMAEGYPDGAALGEAARRPYPKAEAILARYLGADHPMRIWPSRYDSTGRPNRRSGPLPMRGRPARE
jgi:Ner family transcriptional regulator